LPLHRQIISHLDEALESAAGNEQFDTAIVEMGSPSLIVEELDSEKNVSTRGRLGVFLVVLSVILTYFGFMLFLLATYILFVAVLYSVRGSSVASPPITILACLIYEVLFVTFFVRKYRRYRQSRRFRHGSF
jgi:flagellar biosynthesis protein FliP